MTIIPNQPRYGVGPGKRIEDRIRAIAAENGMTLTDITREALRCYVICRDKPLEPNP